MVVGVNMSVATVAASGAGEGAGRNRRAEAWGRMRGWLETGDIPDEAEVETDLTGVQYGFSGQNQIQLERKEDMKKRGLASPDCGDMLAMTFSVQIAAPRQRPASPPVRTGVWS